MTSFQTSQSFENRKLEAQRIREKYPDRVPVICERSPTSKLEPLDKSKYLVPSDMTAYHFNYIIRKRISCRETDSLYLFANNRYLVKGDALMASVYEKHKALDGFLYITYTEETTLGCR
jgi:GABA(A) receptor-associated protein